MNVLLGFSGSVASKLCNSLYERISEKNKVKCIITQSANKLFQIESKLNSSKSTMNFDCYNENSELATWLIDEKVLHIELRNWADCLVIAPLSANILAKIANGICDNLLTNVVRCWDNKKKIILAPAMNTMMWENLFTQQHIQSVLSHYNARIVNPIEKKLACGDYGVGAMANIDDIVEEIK